MYGSSFLQLQQLHFLLGISKVGSHSLQPEDKQRASQQFTKLQAAMKVLGISGEEQKALWLILGAVYHLGAAGATKGRNSHLTNCKYIKSEASR